ncbi:MAG: hypothetical protein K0S38_513 [Candidatus Paceibacter sp.]|jgi:hypothetical protein|nr:hypothetical protein [Candidatus Paceibacter sp.]
MAAKKVRRKNLKPRILKVEETEIGKQLAKDPEARKRFNENVAYFRELARPEIEACERAERITDDDLRTRINY